MDIDVHGKGNHAASVKYGRVMHDNPFGLYHFFFVFVNVYAYQVAIVYPAST